MTAPVGSQSAAGRIRSVVTYLQMTTRPTRPWRSAPRHDLSVVVWRPVSVPAYRELYNPVGAAWRWSARRRMNDHDLATLLNHPGIEFHVLYAGGAAVGFAELDGRVEGEIELRYFGIRPEWFGQKLGPYLLDHTLRHAWSRGIRRYWLHTCTLDHPAALAMYERAGLVRYDQREESEIDPFLDGTIPCPPAGSPSVRSN